MRPDLLKEADAPGRRAARTAALTAAAMLAFASNSLLCRAALRGGHADAVSFTALRLAAGALALGALARARAAGDPAAESAARSRAWGSALALFAYALLFSLAYLRIPAGTGALLLFAAVQLTMIGAGLRSGERPHAREWAGLFVSVVGLVLLTRPGLERPDPLGAVLMLAAGSAWGVYSLRGRSHAAADAVAANARSFARAVPLALAALAAAALWQPLALGLRGALLAAVSGAVTSGLGYALWYAALRGLSGAQAAIVQLSVPPLAAGLGVLLLGESVSVRLVLASTLVLGGIGLAITGRGR